MHKIGVIISLGLLGIAILLARILAIVSAQFGVSSNEIVALGFVLAIIALVIALSVDDK